ncbi:Glucans biosynthesis glucosyltransferase H [Pseudovibrio axinellae]|uniref:Glucans biosynthesis glucosyltransferase H n=1 Tax=Pseudovibrio axinellae TaxID=989403 RepID=A0A165YUV9_9HYPH|nr:glucans biosynthesis glucosyltransferase MdoH [Pseudovibrio axinellae]KZL19256.1 Glucans biosynthesis glucosyltransferase H [Pseudovibrio axinellae]SEQ43999.1 membrane glycosyltransferase [Pseudovibrio axinellae]
MTEQSPAPHEVASKRLVDQLLSAHIVEKHQENKRLYRRRLVFGGLVFTSISGLIGLMVLTLFTSGFTIAKIVMLLAFLVTLPWLVIGFWHAVIGLLLLRFSHDPTRKVYALNSPDYFDHEKPLKNKQTALLSCIRNEDSLQVAAKLEAMLQDLKRGNKLGGFSLYVLSDSDTTEHITQEIREFSLLRGRWQNQIDVFYRRRELNTGYKAGNIADFCRNWGAHHDYAVTLDADSFLSAKALCDLVSKMNASPRLGILQTLVLGLSTSSFFTRVFQWGMRLGMRSFTLGAAWWQGPSGPYWGHNAIFRIKPFIQYCMHDPLPGSGALSGPVLSHDQVEAALMVSAGYEVRVWPVEGGSYEENPPHLIEFIRRDLRWCHGNLQYLKLLRAPGFKMLGRIQLTLAILMFIGSPAWLIFIATAMYLTSTAAPGTSSFDPFYGTLLILILMSMVFAPKLVTLAHVLTVPKETREYGGGLLISVSALLELVFSMLLAPVMAIAHSIFIVQLFAGKKTKWDGQARQPTGIPVLLSIKKFWPQTVFGLCGIAWMTSFSFSETWLLLPVIIGPLLAVPFAMITSKPAPGLYFKHSGLWALPEEKKAPLELLELDKEHRKIEIGLTKEDKAAAIR